MSHQIGYLKMSRGEEVRQRICQNHLAYLNQEETPTKLEQRCNLEGLIAEFLSLVPHNQKFSCPKIGDVLHRSIQENPNFSIYKGATAFQALEKYATNLLNHPWRKEYKIVKLYSGYFKHTVDTHLLNAESIFILLGYEKHNEVLFFEGPIDPDHVTQVALDCLIAYVECQVMIQICEKITNYKCTWDEVHQVREDYICGIDEAVRILQQLKRAEMAEEKHSFEKQQLKSVPREYTLSSLNVSQSTPHTGILVDLSNTWPNVSHSDIIPPPPLPPSQFDSVSHPTKQKVERTSVSHLRSPSWSERVSLQLDRQRQIRRKGSRSEEIDDVWTVSPVSSWTGNNKIGDSTMDRIDDSLDLYMPISKPSFQDNSYISGFTDFDRNSVRMNYGQSSLFKNIYSHPYDFMPHFHPHTNFSFMPHPDIFMNSTRQCQCYTCCEQSSVFSHKDKLGNIEAKEKYRKMEKQASPCVAGAFHQLSLDNYQQLSKPWKLPSEKLQKVENHNTIESTINDDNTINSDVNNRKVHNTNKRTSFYDNLARDAELSFSEIISTKDDDNVSSHAKNILYKGISEKNSNSRNHINKMVSAVELPNNSVLQNTFDSSSLPQKELDKNKWSCSFCTYLNSAEKKICEMCGHSRFTGAESMPLVSGGRECPQCTLVNDKDAKICTACGTSLKDSPTYI